MMGILSSEPDKAPRLVMRCNVFRHGEESECAPVLRREGLVLKPRDLL